MIGWLKKLLPAREPDWSAVPDLTGAGAGMDYWIANLGSNKEFPRVGDLICWLQTDGMGASVRLDSRWRVWQLGEPYPTSFRAYSPNGTVKVFHVYNLRKHTKIKRVWFLLD